MFPEQFWPMLTMNTKIRYQRNFSKFFEIYRIQNLGSENLNILVPVPVPSYVTLKNFSKILSIIHNTVLNMQQDPRIYLIICPRQKHKSVFLFSLDPKNFCTFLRREYPYRLCNNQASNPNTAQVPPPGTQTTRRSPAPPPLPCRTRRPAPTPVLAACQVSKPPYTSMLGPRPPLTRSTRP